MATRNVIIELAHTAKLESNALEATADAAVALNAGAVPALASVQIDPSFPPVALPQVTVGEHPEGEIFDSLANITFDAAPENSTYIVRGTVEEDALEDFVKEANKSKAVVSVYADVAIEPMIICPGSPALGTDADVENRLSVSRLRRCRMDGSGVLVAIVDTGVNMAYLNSKGKTPTFDAARSWAWNPAAVTPGSAPVGHGTMCAYDVCIAAPRCTILDIALLRPLSAPPGGTLMSALLSDAIRAFRHLIDVISAPRRPGESRSLVVNNSWGMFHPSWDFPVGHPSNYSDNPNHPFNRIVATLERAGADILFAAGNCGADCPDGRCQGVTTRAIYGANSSPHVTCVAGVDINHQRVGYSSIGPGRLTTNKPDISGYTHFRGSGVYAADGGTSAATPVVAGVVAAVRSIRPFNPADSSTSPPAMRNLIISTATDLGATGYDFQHGHGVVNGARIASKFLCRPIFDLCKINPRFCFFCRRYPHLCRPHIENICKRFPIICEGIRKEFPIPPIPPDPRRPPQPIGSDFGSLMFENSGYEDFNFGESGGEVEDLSEEEIAFWSALLSYQPSSSSTSEEKKSGGCACGGKD
jgi:hypothetical protein